MIIKQKQTTMKTYIKMQQEKEMVDELTQEWMDFCERDYKIHMGLGILSVITYVIGIIGILNI